MVLQIILLVGAYLIGSLSGGIIITKLTKNIDPRTQGSNNPGATNVLRLSGVKLGIAVLLFDSLKGFLPIFLAKYYGVADNILAVAALLIFIGHLYPIFFKFKGGKGVATALGVMLAWSPLLGGILIANWFLIAALTRYSSFSALCTSVLSLMYVYVLLDAKIYLVCATLMMIFTLYRHKSNIINLYNGSEDKIGQQKC